MINWVSNQDYFHPIIQMINADLSIARSKTISYGIGESSATRKGLPLAVGSMNVITGNVRVDLQILKTLRTALYIFDVDLIHQH